MSDHAKATKAAISAGCQALVKRVPGLNELLEAMAAYKSSIEKQNLEAIIDNINQKVDRLGPLFDHSFYNTDEGQRLAFSILNSAKVVSNHQKVEYLSSLFVVSADHAPLFDRQTEFLSMIEHLSHFALYVACRLWEEEKLFEVSIAGKGNLGLQLSQVARYKSHRIDKSLSDSLGIQFDEIKYAISELKSKGILESDNGMEEYVKFTGIGSEFAIHISDPTVDSKL